MDRSEQDRREIREFYESAFKRARDAAADHALSDVRVRPGQDPYEAGFAALFSQEGNVERQAREDAKKQTKAKYHLTDNELDLILKSE